MEVGDAYAYSGHLRGGCMSQVLGRTTLYGISVDLRKS